MKIELSEARQRVERVEDRIDDAQRRLSLTSNVIKAMQNQVCSARRVLLCAAYYVRALVRVCGCLLSVSLGG